MEKTCFDVVEERTRELYAAAEVTRALLAPLSRVDS